MSAVEVWVSIEDVDVRAGTLYSHRRRGGNTESSSFSYLPEYIAHPRAYALEPGLPLQSGAHQRVRMVTNRPEIVCICGSAKFMAEMRAANRDLTFGGVIVLAPSEADETPTAGQKAVLDELHLRKIDLADRVLVVNPGGYVGESTRREISYAQAAGKAVAFTHPPDEAQGW